MKPLDEMGKFATVVVDPPWPLAPLGLTKPSRDGGPPRFKAELPYGTMGVDEIKAMPISSVSCHDAIVFCWTTNKFLPDTFGIVEAWGFIYKFVMVWHKSGGIQTPVTPSFNAEYLVVAGKGHPAWLETKAFSTANYWPRGGHSKKPEGFYDLLRRVTPGPRLDVFGRRRIAGFTSWGNEAPEGDPLPDHYQQVLIG